MLGGVMKHRVGGAGGALKLALIRSDRQYQAPDIG